MALTRTSFNDIVCWPLRDHHHRRDLRHLDSARFSARHHQILFTKPISKFAYLGGRWAGSFVTTVFAFSGCSSASSSALSRPGPIIPASRPTICGGISSRSSPSLSCRFFLGTLFSRSPLSRAIFIVYLQGAALFMIYLIGMTVFSATRSLEHFWSGIFDPIGLHLNDAITRYWTVVEKNTLLYSWSLHVSYWRLPLQPVALDRRRISRSDSLDVLSRCPRGSHGSPAVASVPPRPPRGGRANCPRPSSWPPGSRRASDLRPRHFIRPVPLPHAHAHLAISSASSLLGASSVLMVAFALNNGHYAGRVGDVNVWPVTYLMLQAVEGGATLFFYIVATFYAAELIWRERDTQFEGIHDALPMRETTDWLSKFTALCIVELSCSRSQASAASSCRPSRATTTTSYSSTSKSSTSSRSRRFSSSLCSHSSCRPSCPTNSSDTRIVIGHLRDAVRSFSILAGRTRYTSLATPPYTYSDMNGYGHFVPPLFWSITYWLSICAFWLSSRLHLHAGARKIPSGAPAPAAPECPAPRAGAALFVCVAVGSGRWYLLQHARPQ